MFDGSIVMDDSAVIYATHVQNDNDVTPVGYIKKSLTKQNWWSTTNDLSTEQSNIVWVSALCK